MTKKIMKNSIPRGVEVNKYLAEGLRSRKWTQAEAARFFGVSNHTFGRFLRNEYGSLSDPRNMILSKNFETRLFEFTGHLIDEVFPKKDDFKEILFCEIDSEKLFSIRLEALSPLENAELALLRQRLLVALSTLTSKEEFVLRQRNFADKTLEEIGTMLGISRERVRMIESKAIRKLRNPSLVRTYMDFCSAISICDRCGYLTSRCLGACKKLKKDAE